MSETNFIYHNWLRSMLDLSNALDLDPKQRNKMREWFANRLFEFGITQEIDNYAAEHAKIDVEKEISYGAARQLGQMIFDKKLYTVEKIRQQYQTHYRFTMLMCGTPKYTGSAERHE